MNFEVVDVLILFGESIIHASLYSFLGMGFMGFLALLSGGYLLTKIPKWAWLLLFPSMVSMCIMDFLFEKFNIKQEGVGFGLILIISSLPFA